MSERQVVIGMRDLIARTERVAAGIEALVEQQRIANLIALAGQGSDSFETALPILRDEAAAALMEFVRSEATQITDAEDFPETRPEIRKALGLS